MDNKKYAALKIFILLNFIIQTQSQDIGIKRVIVTVDTGIDDYYALMALIYAETIDLVKIEAIVCAQGNANVTSVVKNTVRFLELVNRTDIPIYQGVENPLILPRIIVPYYGDDGLGDLQYNSEPLVNIVQNQLPPPGLRDLVDAHPGEISLLSLSPLTDVAITSKLCGNFISNLKDIWIIGGNSENASYIGLTAEFYFLADPEAAHILFETDSSKRMYLFPLEVFQYASNMTWNWRFDTLRNNTPAMDLITRAEQALGFYENDPIWNPSDALLTFCFLQPQFCNFDSNMRSMNIELHDQDKRAWIMFDSDANKAKNIQIIRSVNNEQLQNFILKATGTEV